MTHDLITRVPAALGINAVAVGVGDEHHWWINLIGAVIALVVTVLTRSKRQ